MIGEKAGSIGRKKVIIIGLIIMTTAVFLFAAAAFFKNGAAFYTVSLIARLAQGVADAMICVAMFSIVSIEWPEKNEYYQGLLQMAMGFGLMMGPVISAAVVTWFKYQGTLFFFGCIIAVVGLGMSCLIPARLNDPDTPEGEEADEEEIPFSIFFKVPRSLVCITSFTLYMICFFYFDPTLAITLTTEHGMSDADAGLGFALIAFTFGGMSPISGLLC